MQDGSKKICVAAAFRTYTGNYLSSPSPFFFFFFHQKATGEWGLTCTLHFFPVLPWKLWWGWQEYLSAIFVWCLLGSHLWLQSGLASTNLLLWQGQLCECLSGVTPPCGIVYNFSNYFIFKVGLTLLFCFNRIFSHGRLACGGCELHCVDNLLAQDFPIFSQTCL